MGKVKHTILFNKNNIKLEKTELISTNKTKHSESPYVTCKTLVSNPNCYSTRSYSYYRKSQKVKNTKSVIIRKKSPLGFYYNSKKIEDNYNNYNTNEITNSNSYTLKICTFILSDNESYTLKYYTGYNGVKINVETRPWEICAKTAMPDHQINALLKLLIDLFANISDKHGYYSKENLHGDFIRKNISEAKHEIFIDLFGYKNGPKAQTNEQKILSHGFDLKTSFRKRSEK